MPRVSISDTSKCFEVNDKETLYDALFDRGEELPHGCLSGSCGACKIEVIEGNENLSEPSFIEKNTLDAIREEVLTKFGKEKIENKTIRLSCRAKILKNEVTIKPFKID